MKDEKHLGADAAEVANDTTSVHAPQLTHVDRHACEEQISTGWRLRDCGKTAKYHELKWGTLGWFCKMHAPSERKKRQDARDEKRRVKMQPVWYAQERERRLKVSALEMLAELKSVKPIVCAVNCPGINGETLFHGERCKQLAAVIAKAEGHTPESSE